MRFLFSEVRFLLDRIKSKDSFVRNFSITFSWSTIAVIVGFLFTPFVARLYSPEAYGLFAIYISLAQSISMLITLQLTRAFTLVETESELQKLLTTTIVIVIAFVGVLILFCVTLKVQILNFLNITLIGNFLYLLPFTTLLFAICDIFRSWNIRYKYFKQNAVNQLVASVAPRSLAIAYALVIPVKNVGLIVGDLISKIIESIHLGWYGAFQQVKKGLLEFNSGNGIQETLAKFKNYPLFVLPSSLIALIATQTPLFFIAKFYSAGEAGQFSLANSMLNIPVNVLAGAIAPIFLQRVSDAYRTDRNTVGQFVSETAKRLFYIGLSPILLLTIFGDLIFKFVFGAAWVQSGVMAGYMGFYFLFTVINFPLLSVYRILKLERYLLFSSLIQVLINVATLSFGYKFFDSVVNSILLFSISNVVYYLLNIGFIFRISGVNAYTYLIRWFFSATILYVMFRLLRTLFEYLEMIS